MGKMLHKCAECETKDQPQFKFETNDGDYFNFLCEMCYTKSYFSKKIRYLIKKTCGRVVSGETTTVTTLKGKEAFVNECVIELMKGYRSWLGLSQVRENYWKANLDFLKNKIRKAVTVETFATKIDSSSSSNKCDDPNYCPEHSSDPGNCDCNRRRLGGESTVPDHTKSRPSEDVIRHRRLMKHPASHTVVLERLLEEIQALQ